MELLKHIKEGRSEYAFLEDKYRERLEAAYNRAIPCIIKTQINDAGKPSA